MSAIRYRLASTGLLSPCEWPVARHGLSGWRECAKERVNEAYKSLPGAAYGDEVGDRRFEPARVASSQRRKG
jgi:hypothetical protein